MRSPSLLLRLSQRSAAFSPTLGWRASESSSQSALTHDQTAHQKQAASDRPNRGGGGPGELVGGATGVTAGQEGAAGPSASALT